MNRYTAAFSHFLISALVLTAFLTVMRFAWYPDFYFTANGGWGVLAILIGVDLVLGPALTLLVFKPGKPSLKFDLSVIVLLQVSALLYGGSVIYKERPLFMAYYNETFEIMTANELARVNPEMDVVKDVDGSGQWPQVVFTEMPEDKALRKELTEQMLHGKFWPPKRPDYYQTLAPQLQKVVRHAMDKQTLLDRKILSAQEVEQLIDGHSNNSVGFYKVYGKTKNLIIAMDLKSGEVLAGIAPPERKKK